MKNEYDIAMINDDNVNESGNEIIAKNCSHLFKQLELHHRELRLS